MSNTTSNGTQNPPNAGDKYGKYEDNSWHDTDASGEENDGNSGNGTAKSIGMGADDVGCITAEGVGFNVGNEATSDEQ